MFNFKKNMKGKLYKENDSYTLFVDGKIFGDTRGHHLSSITNTLSLKNCQVIERGYDLDEIKRKVFDGFDGQPNSFTIAAVERTIQIMLELIGDKKFSEDDLMEAYSRGQTNSPIQSLQQTEWDVEVVMEKIDLSFGCYKIQTKFDEEGCLILKRI